MNEAINMEYARIEQRILSRALIFEDQLAMLIDIESLSGFKFEIEAHNILFAAVKNIRNEGGPLRPVGLLDELNQMCALETVGGAAYIGELLGCMPHEETEWRIHSVENTLL